MKTWSFEWILNFKVLQCMCVKVKTLYICLVLSSSSYGGNITSFVTHPQYPSKLPHWNTFPAWSQKTTCHLIAPTVWNIPPTLPLCLDDRKQIECVAHRTCGSLSHCSNKWKILLFMSVLYIYIYIFSTCEQWTSGNWVSLVLFYDAVIYIILYIWAV